MEIWKEINNINGYYISNYGRVMADEVLTKFGNRTKKYPKRIINQWRSKAGYNYIDISILGKKHRFLLDRLVAIYFIPNTEKKPQVNHINANKDDNCMQNLEWCTASHNLKHARDLGLNKSIGSDNKMAKFSDNQICEIRKSKRTVTEIAKDYKVSPATISRILSNHIYKKQL